jgi:hypothetical protein
VVRSAESVMMYSGRVWGGAPKVYAILVDLRLYFERFWKLYFDSVFELITDFDDT